jgi:hypothetical protein
MKTLKFIYQFLLMAALVVMGACVDQLEEMNQNPNGIEPSSANPNLLMPHVLSGVGTSYNNLGFGDIAGTIQHTQKDGWWGGHNIYDWGPRDWTGWYGLLRTNDLMLRRAEELDFQFHGGIGLTMRAFIFANITDIWGDAPYTEALRGNTDVLFPQFDSQELIYQGILDDLGRAVEIFASGNTTGMNNANDLYYGGNIDLWRRFANSLRLRYYMRLSEKMPQLARTGVESIYQSGIYLQGHSQDATMAFLGNVSSDSWPNNVPQSGSAGSEFRRQKPCTTLTNLMLGTEDPRTLVWFRPVHCQWVEDTSLDMAIEPFIRRNGVLLDGVRSYLDAQYMELIAQGNKFTRHFNPVLKAADPALRDIPIDTREIVGVPPGVSTPDGYNFNPTVGQTIENQHVSQLADMYREPSGPMLRTRIMSAAEVHFIFAEAAAKGWSTGSAEEHYRAGIQQSLNTWGVGNQFSQFIEREDVAFNSSDPLPQIAAQKWVASWTCPEGWFDWRRTGMPAMSAGPAALEPVVAVRFPYGDNEINFNAQNLSTAIGRLETGSHGSIIGPNNQWAKPWVIQGTGKPW